MKHRIRKEIEDKSELGKRAAKFVESGKLVPDQLIFEIIKGIICGKDSENGFLMDGFPRNLAQAKLFSSMLEDQEMSIDKVLNISIEAGEAINRLTRRMTCGVCQRYAYCLRSLPWSRNFSHTTSEHPKSSYTSRSLFTTMSNRAFGS